MRIALAIAAAALLLASCQTDRPSNGASVTGTFVDELARPTREANQRFADEHPNGYPNQGQNFKAVKNRQAVAAVKARHLQECRKAWANNQVDSTNSCMAQRGYEAFK